MPQQAERRLLQRPESIHFDLPDRAKLLNPNERNRNRRGPIYFPFMNQRRMNMDKLPSSPEPSVEVISTYTRAQALEDGLLLDVTEVAREVGFCWPVAMTRAAWEDCVAWSETDNQRQLYQDESARLWDVLWVAWNAIRRNPRNEPWVRYHLCRVPRDGKSVTPSAATLKLVAGPDDGGEPVVTILHPDED